MKIPALVVGMLSTVALAACATTAPQSATPPANSTWRFLTIDGIAPASPEAKLTLINDRLSANVGCNVTNGSWRLEKGHLVVTSPLAQTLMACPRPVMENEGAFTALLSSSPTLEMTGNRMILRSKDHSAELEQVP